MLAPAESPTEDALAQLSAVVDTVLSNFEKLNMRQRQIVSCVVVGMDNGLIAQKCELLVGSVRSMISVIYSILGVPVTVPHVRRLYLRAAGLRALEKATECDEVLAQIQEFLSGQASSGRRRAEGPRGEPSSTVDVAAVAALLANASNRLRTVARCIAEGLSIDTELQISGASVAGYVSELYLKLGLPSSVGWKERRRIVAAAHRCLAEGPQQVRQDSGVEHVDRTEERPALLGDSKEPVAIPAANRATGGGHDSESAPPQCATGVPVVLSDPSSVVDVRVVSGESESGMLASHMVRSKKEGFLPEILLVYPPDDLGVSRVHLVLIRREPK